MKASKVLRLFTYFFIPFVGVLAILETPPWFFLLLYTVRCALSLSKTDFSGLNKMSLKNPGAGNVGGHHEY